RRCKGAGAGRRPRRTSRRAPPESRRRVGRSTGSLRRRRGEIGRSRSPTRTASRSRSFRSSAPLLEPRARAALAAVAETLGPGAVAAGLADRMALAIGRLPREADRAELVQLLGLLESRAANLALAGVPRRFSALSLPERERFLRGWATSWLPLKRKAFQALKRLAAFLSYTPDGSGAWERIGYPGPLGPPPPPHAPRQPPRRRDRDRLPRQLPYAGAGPPTVVPRASPAAFRFARVHRLGRRRGPADQREHRP